MKMIKISSNFKTDAEMLNNSIWNETKDNYRY